MADEKKPPSLSKFRDHIFTSEPLAIHTFSFLSFKDSVALIQSHRKLNLLKHPFYQGELHLVWYALLEKHWQAFIENNALYRFKKVYGWSPQTVQAIVDILRTKNATLIEDEKEPLPRYYLPEKLLEGDEELPYLYSLIPIYNDKYHIRHIDLQGPAVHVLAPNMPLFQIVLPTATQPSFVARTAEEETLVDRKDRTLVASWMYQYMQEANRLNNMEVSLFCDLTSERDRLQQLHLPVVWNSIFSGIIKSRKADDRRLSNKFMVIPKKFPEDPWLFLMILQTSMPRL